MSVLTIAGAFLIAKSIASSIIGIERNVALLKEGDLSKRAEIASRDEIGYIRTRQPAFAAWA